MKAPTDTLKWGLYRRKSSEADDRQVASLESQQKELEELAKRESLDVLEEFNLDEAHSAKRPGRPVFGQLLKLIERGKVNALLVWSPNRISRNAVDTGLIIDLMDRGLLKEVRTPSQVFRNTPNDKFLLNLFCSQGKLENDNKGEDVKRGLRHKATAGNYPSHAPLGYKNEPGADAGTRRILVDEVRFPLVRKMWDYMLTGKYSVAEIVRLANDVWGLRTPIRKNGTGGKKITKSLAYYIFNRTFYYCEYEYPVGSGNWHKGNHKAMITRTEYDRVQILLGRKGRPRPKTREFAYRTGAIVCGECGGSVTAEVKHHCVCSNCKYKFSCTNKTACPKCGTDIADMQNPTIRKYVFYHCAKRTSPSCKQGSISEAELEKQVIARLSEFEVTEGFTDWALGVLKGQNTVEADIRRTILKTQRKAYDAAVEKIDALIDMRAGKELDEEEYRRKKATALKEKNRLFGLLQDTDKRVENWLDVAERGFDFAETARARFADDDSEDLHVRKELFATLGSNYTLKDKKLTVKADDLLFAIKNVKDERIAEAERFEPSKSGSTETPIASPYSPSPRLLPDLDSNQDTFLQRE